MYHCLDIKKILNNKGITHTDRQDEGFLDFGGLSLPKCQFPGNNIIWKDIIPFRFELEEEWDNFELDNQSIPLKPKKYKDLFIVGTCNNGNYYEKMDLLYNGKLVKTAYFHLSDFLSDIHSGRDEVLLNFDYVHSHEGPIDFMKPKIWVDHISLEEPTLLNYMKFEQNPSVHIFAITLKE